MARTILVVDDEATLRETVVDALEAEGFRVLAAADGREALTRFRADRPDLILLDLMLPELSGIEVCRIIRAESGVPIVMLTAKDSELDKVVGLELGADDYVTKPFSPRELTLRIKAVLRRGDGGPPAAVLEAGTIRLDPAAHEATIGGESLGLTATEFRLLQLLLERRGRVQSRAQLLSEVWGYAEDVDSRTVDTHVRRLRRKLGAEADRLETVVGVGYRLRA